MFQKINTQVRLTRSISMSKYNKGENKKLHEITDQETDKLDKEEDKNSVTDPEDSATEGNNTILELNEDAAEECKSMCCLANTKEIKNTSSNMR